MLDTTGGLHGMMSRLPGEEERPRKVSEVKGSRLKAFMKVKPEEEARERSMVWEEED